MNSLSGKIALVTGASRGVGKGIALGLAQYGATVYVTGRTESGEALPEFLKSTSIHDTAKAVTDLGGIGIAKRCDHANDDDVKKLFEEIEKEQGRLDILVNNAWAGAQHVMNGYFYNTPFWEQPISLFDDFHRVGMRSNYLASHYAAKLMTKQKSGLVVNISYESANHYWINVTHGLIKAATDKFTSDAAMELKEYGVKMISLHPGTVLTEGMIEFAKYDSTFKIEEMESPQFVGHCIAALAMDEAVIEQTGKALLTKEIASQYHITEQ